MDIVRRCWSDDSSLGTYQRPAHKIPHEIHIVLAGGGRHVRLLQVRRHGWVVGEFVEESSQLLGEPFPFGREGDGGKGDGCEAGGEFFAG